jgi:CRISPR-associated protein Cas1
MSVIYIHEQGAYLRKNGGRFVVTKKDDELFSIPEAALDGVVIFGNVQISTQAVNELLNNGIELIYLSFNGKFKGILKTGHSKNVFRRLAQYDAAINHYRAFSFAKWFAYEKIKDEINMIERWQKRNLIENNTDLKAQLNIQLNNINTKTDTFEIRGSEGVAAKIYFSTFYDIVPPPFEWNGRNRQPPLDPVNALLSLTYMMTLSKIISQSYIHGFDPFIGFLHELDYGRPSFALDILELFRAGYCDRFVMDLFLQERFFPDDFLYSKNDGCRLKNEPFKLYLKYFQDFLTKKYRHIDSLDFQLQSVFNQLKQNFKE